MSRKIVTKSHSWNGHDSARDPNVPHGARRLNHHDSFSFPRSPNTKLDYQSNHFFSPNRSVPLSPITNNEKTNIKLPDVKTMSPAAATTQIFFRTEYKHNIEARSKYWKKYRVEKRCSSAHDVAALTYKDRKDWNVRHNVNTCLTHLSKIESEIFWKWFNDRLQEHFPDSKNHAQTHAQTHASRGGVDLSNLAQDFVRWGVFSNTSAAFALLERIDIDRNGKVSHREFVDVMTAHNEDLAETALLRKFIFSLKSKMDRERWADNKAAVSKKLHKMIQERKMAAAFVAQTSRQV